MQDIIIQFLVRILKEENLVTKVPDIVVNYTNIVLHMYKRSVGNSAQGNYPYLQYTICEAFDILDVCDQWYTQC